MADKNSKKGWRAPQSPLAQALEGWSHISQTVKEEKIIPPDQKMLNDITNLLVQLKTKLDELSVNTELEGFDALTTEDSKLQSEESTIESTITTDANLIGTSSGDLATHQENKSEELAHEDHFQIHP